MSGTPWYLAPSLVTFRGQLNVAFPGRCTRSDGTIGDLRHQLEAGGSDHNPDDSGCVCAFDGTHGPYWHLTLADAGRVYNELIKSGDPRIAYVIFDGEIWSYGKGRRPYHGVSPHKEHFHLSVKHGVLAHDASPWNLPSFGGVPTVSVTDLIADPITTPITTPPDDEDTDMQLQIIQAQGREGVFWLRDGNTRSHIVDTQALEELQALIKLAGGNPEIHTLSPSTFDSFGAV